MINVQCLDSVFKVYTYITYLLNTIFNCGKYRGEEMANINKKSTSGTDNKIISKIMNWVGNLFNRHKTENSTVTQTKAEYYSCPEYESQRIRKEAQDRIEKIKYQARRNW